MKVACVGRGQGTEAHGPDPDSCAGGVFTRLHSEEPNVNAFGGMRVSFGSKGSSINHENHCAMPADFFWGWIESHCDYVVDSCDIPVIYAWYTPVNQWHKREGSPAHIFELWVSTAPLPSHRTGGSQSRAGLRSAWCLRPGDSGDSGPPRGPLPAVPGPQRGRQDPGRPPLRHRVCGGVGTWCDKLVLDIRRADLAQVAWGREGKCVRKQRGEMGGSIRSNS